MSWSATVSSLAMLALVVMMASLTMRSLVDRRARRRLDTDAHPTRPSPNGRRFDSLFTRRRADGGARQLAQLLEDIARRCAAGESLAESLREVAVVSPLTPRFVGAIRALERGASVEEALTAANNAVTDADTVLTLHVLTLCASNGGAIAEALDRAAATLRERDAIDQERRAQSAQARLSAMVLTCLPIAFGAWSIFTSRAVRAFLGTAPGVACIVVGCALNIAGWQLMTRLIGTPR